MARSEGGERGTAGHNGGCRVTARPFTFYLEHIVQPLRSVLARPRGSFVLAHKVKQAVPSECYTRSHICNDARGQCPNGARVATPTGLPTSRVLCKIGDLHLELGEVAPRCADGVAQRNAAVGQAHGPEQRRRHGPILHASRLLRVGQGRDALLDACWGEAAERCDKEVMCACGVRLNRAPRAPVQEAVGPGRGNMEDEDRRCHLLGWRGHILGAFGGSTPGDLFWSTSGGSPGGGRNTDGTVARRIAPKLVPEALGGQEWSSRGRVRSVPVSTTPLTALLMAPLTPSGREQRKQIWDQTPVASRREPPGARL